MAVQPVAALGPVFLDIAGLSLTPEESEIISNPLVGGIIFFARNYRDRAQLAELVVAIRAVRPDILLAVDQEGGRVQRFQHEFTRIPAMQKFLAIADAKERNTLLQDAGWLLAAEVLSTGVDISFAPVLDVDDCLCSVIADRSFSADAMQVSELAGHFIAGMHEAGMAVTGKHFPGHGSVTSDSHLELPVDERSWAEIAARDLLPFQALATQLDAVMPAHIVFPKIDSQPVGFSQLWLQQKLRRDLGFDGVIFSDDLTMAGAAGVGSYPERADLALQAGCDMVLVCNNSHAAHEIVAHLQTQATVLSHRAPRMRRRQEWSWTQLQSNARWQRTRSALAQLL